MVSVEMPLSPVRSQRPFGRQGGLAKAEAEEIAAAKATLPGGVLGGNRFADDAEFVFKEAQGARFRDVSGNEYIDYCLGSGTMVLGHAHPAVTKAIVEQAPKGTHYFTYLNEPAVRAAAKVVAHVPCVEKLRFTTSGSEATFHALRLARAFTKRNKILKFEGAYHGHHDYAQLSTSPKRAADYPTAEPDSAGIPEVVRALVLVAPFNDLEATRRIVEANRPELAAIIVEPIQRVITPAPGFLGGLRALADAAGAVLVFDEVVTGWRLALGGAQEHYGVTPDLATFGKIIGGGLPVGAVGGRGDIMDQCDPGQKGAPGFVYQNGTLQANPLGAAASLATLTELERPGTYESLYRLGDELRRGLRRIVERHALGAIVCGYGGIWHILFTNKEPRNHRDVMAADGKRLVAFDTELIRQGVFVLPGTRRFVSLVHGERDFEDTFRAFDAACRRF
ncbi:MAG: aspartate aminotransferase family protein [Alphaproteobacteria bacterium]